MYYFLEHFDELTAQDASSWSRTGKLITSNICCVCLRASGCVCFECVRHCFCAASHGHNLMTNSAYKSALQASLSAVRILLVNAQHTYTTLQHAKQICWELQKLGWLLSSCWPCYKFPTCGTTCQRASLAEKQDVNWHTHILRRCPLFSTHPTWTTSATNAMNSFQFT